MPPLLGRRRGRSARALEGPIVLIANLLTEGSGMSGYTRGRRRSSGGRRDQASGGRHHRQQCAAVAGRSGTLRVGAQDAAASRRRAARAVKSSKARSGAATSRATTGGAWRMRCGRCCRSGCSDLLSYSDCLRVGPRCVCRRIRIRRRTRRCRASARFALGRAPSSSPSAFFAAGFLRGSVFDAAFFGRQSSEPQCSALRPSRSA